jgi:putative ABC transport system substrate-binding protein
MRAESLGRRAFIAVLSGAAALPLAGHAQQRERIPRVGVLIGFAEDNPRARAGVTAFGQALQRLGWVEGKNIRIDSRFAAGDLTLLKPYAAELIDLSPDAIFAQPTPAALALREQTRTIPIVFALVNDPIGLGLVQSLARPGGNITGFSSYDAPLMGKWLQLLKDVAPDIVRVTIIFNPDTAFAPPFLREMEADPSFGVTVTLAPVHDQGGIEEAIAAQAREPGGGLIILPDPFNGTHGDVIVAAAARHRLPLIGTPTFARAGGLMSYFFDTEDPQAQAASYIDRILKGTSPADLPVQQPTKYSLIINLKTAKALGLTVPPSMLDLADEVIE